MFSALPASLVHSAHSEHAGGGAEENRIAAAAAAAGAHQARVALLGLSAALAARPPTERCPEAAPTNARPPLLPPCSGGSGDDAEGGGGGDDAAPPPSLGASLSQTVFNIANIYIGLGLLTMPYAAMKGGWLAVGVLAALVPLFALSGRLICAAFDQLPPGSLKTFPELGRAAAGAAGQRAVYVFCSLELFGATIVLLMISWQMLELLLPPEGEVQ